MLTSKVTGLDLPEFGPKKKKEPLIVVASEYGSVHTKAWITPKKKPVLQRDRHVKGPCRMRGPEGTRTFDSSEEMLKQMWRDTDKKLDAYRYPDQESFTNVEKQTGKGMWSNELVRGILKANPYLFVEDSLNVKGCAGFYKMVDGQKVPAGKPNASFRHGYMPEATIMKEDRAALVTEFVYGWRQVLIRLRRSGDLTVAQFRKLYGVVDYGDERGKHFASDLGDFGV